MSRIFITGIGAISPIGFDVNKNLLNLRSAKSGIDFAKFFKSRYADTYQFGEVKKRNEEIISDLKLQSVSGITRTDILAFTAFSEAINDAKLSKKEISSYDTAFISASTAGGLCLTDQMYADINLLSDTTEFVNSYFYSTHSIRIIQQYNIKGFTDTVNTACSSSANSIMLGCRLIQTGRASRVIVGGVDSLAKFTVNGFAALNILSEDVCKPFDQNRKGLTLGEAAAYLVLESEEVAEDKEKYAEVLGYGNANDAYHTSALSDQATGIVQSILQAIEVAKISESDIDYINAHGTATENNDFSELLSFNKIFKTVPVFSSTKAFTGHTLGAAGALEAIYSVLSIKNQELYPNLNFQNKMLDFDNEPVTKYTPNFNIDKVLSNSYGFNGSCTSLIFSRI